MRVLHIQKASGIGGCERHLLALLPALLGRGIEVEMCLLGTTGVEKFREPLEELGVKSRVLPAGPDANPLLFGRVIREIRRASADVVHTHLIHGDTYGQLSAWLLGVPGVSSIHGANPNIYGREPIRSVARTAGHLAKRTIAISQHIVNFLRLFQVVPQNRVRLIYYGIDVANWVVEERERDRERARLGLNQDNIAVGVASRLVPSKGHEYLLKAFSEAHRAMPNLRLLVAGDGPLRMQLEAQAHSMLPKHVFEFLGHLSDVRQFMSACDLIAFPSLPLIGEGFGLASLEAMAAGRPVIASALESLSEIVVDKRTGFLVAPGAIHDMADRLVMLARNGKLRAEVGANGREHALRKFPIGRMVDSTIRVYEEAIHYRSERFANR